MHNNRSSLPVPRFGLPCVFKLLQIPFSANLLFSHPCKTLGVYPLRPSFRFGLGALGVAIPLVYCVFNSLQPLFLSLPSFYTRVPLFSETCSLFCQNTGGIGGVSGGGGA